MRIGFILRGPLRMTGGLERVLINLLRVMTGRGHTCVLFYPEPRIEEEGEALLPDVERVVFPLSAAETFYPRTRTLLVNSGIDLLCALYNGPYIINLPALLNRSGIPLLLSEHIAPQLMEGRYWTPYERRACFAAADGVHLLLDEYKALLPSFLQERVTVIPHPSEPGVAVDFAAREKAEPKRILAVGRFLEQQKQFLLLLSAFAVLADRFPGWELCLCGDGEDGKRYKEFAAGAGLAARVRFPGWVEDIDAYYASAHIFCLPSASECFSLVLSEAQRHALPLVGFAACFSANARILDGVNGLLAPEMTAESLAVTLAMLMSRPSLRAALGLRGREMLAALAPEKIYDQWEGLFAAVAGAKGRTRLQVPEMTEEDRVRIALSEILARENPECRPACLKLERQMQALKRGTPR